MSVRVDLTQMLHASGANVLPIQPGLKAPVGTWKHWQTRRQSEADVRDLPWGDADRCGIVNGVGGFRSFDLDQSPDDAPLAALLAALGLPADYAWAERSDSGEGHHVWVICGGDLPAGALPTKRRRDGGDEPGVYWGPSKHGDFDHLELRWERSQTVVAASRDRDRWTNGVPDGPPACVTIGDVINAFYAIAQHSAPPAVPERTAVPAHPNGTAGRGDLDAIRDRFDLAAYARTRYPGDVRTEANGEIRILGHGGLLIDPRKGVWYRFDGEVGGDCFDLVGEARYGEAWDRKDGGMFRAAKEEAAAFAGVALGDDEGGRIAMAMQHGEGYTPKNLRALERDLSDRIADGGEDGAAAAAEGVGPRLYTTYGPDDLRAMPPLQFRINGWLPENSLIGIIGKSGDMKTFVALDQAFAIATDREWNGCDVRGGPVLYVAAEGKFGVGQRVSAWETARKATIDPARFRLITEAPQMLTEENVDALIATVQRWRAEAVFIDTLARTMDGEENSTKDMSDYVKACNRIQRETGAAVVVVHHMGWNSDRQRGSSALHGAMDAEMTVTKDGDTVRAKVTKGKDFPEGAEMAFAPRVVELPGGGTSLVLDRQTDDAPWLSSAAQRVGVILWDTFGDAGATLTDWKRVCVEKGFPEHTFFGARKALEKDGFITKPTVARGHHYTVTDAFAPYLPQPETPDFPENRLKPIKPSFSPAMAGNPKTATGEGLGRFGEGLQSFAPEGLGGAEWEFPAIADTTAEGLIGLGRFGEGLQTFGEVVEGDRFEGLAPPIGGKPSNLHPIPSATIPDSGVGPPPSPPFCGHEIDAVGRWADKPCVPIAKIVARFCHHHGLDADPLDLAATARAVGDKLALLRAQATGGA